MHVGNLRSAVVADLFVRIFRLLGYAVRYVRNITDIDDKIIAQAKFENCSVTELTQRTTREVEADFQAMGLSPPDHSPKVSDHLPEIITMIQTLIEGGFAYVTSAHEVHFRVNRFAAYGALSGKVPDELMSGARVEVNEAKEQASDFILWKPAKSDEPAWPSPWGLGRPGWHIECSAMAKRWLGPTLDVHHGGEDLIFPHHENEIAQSESANRCPMSLLWLHHGLITLRGEKMAKSIGNVILARDFIQAYGAEVVRFVLLSVHYRSSVDLHSQSIQAALHGLNRIYEAKFAAEALLPGITVSELAQTQADQDLSASIRGHLANDCNVPEVLGCVFHLIREFNRYQTKGDQGLDLASRYLNLLHREISPVLGLGGSSSAAMLSHLNEIRGRTDPLGILQETQLTAVEVEILLDQRKAARMNRDFRTADSIRDQLLEQGIDIQDSAEGTSWRYGI